MVNIPPNLCLMPFTSLHISPNGSIRLCSSSLSELGSIRDVKDLSIIWNNESFQNVREEMNSNGRPKVCVGACYKMEDRGLISKRQDYNRKYPHMAGKHTIKHLDIAFSNQCNLACAMCSSLYSTQWAKLEDKISESGIDFRLPPVAPFRLSEEISEQLVEHLPSIEKILIKGGEPLLENKCIKFLEMILKNKSNLHPKLKIFIQSNGTVVSEKFKNLSQNLPIELGISIDGVGKTYEWIRGFPFKKLKANIYKLCNFYGLQCMHFNFTLSAYNVFNLEEMLEFYFKSKNDNVSITRFSISGIAKQKWASATAIPKPHREKAVNYLKSLDPELLADVYGLQNAIRYLEFPFDPQAHLQFRRWESFMSKQRFLTLSEVDNRYLEILGMSYQ